MSYNNNNYQPNYQSNYQPDYQPNYQPNYQYYNGNGNPTNTNMTEPYNGQGSSNQRYIGNDSTRSLGGATAIGTPRVNPTGDAGEVDSIDSRYDVYNRQNQEAPTGDATDAVASNQLEQQPRYSLDEGDSHTGSTLTKRDSTTVLTSTQQQPLIGQSTHDLGDIRNQHYYDYNQSSGFYSQYNKYHRQDDPYYDEEATRHNTLTSRDPNAYNFENDYTDRDFPGSGKGARQSMTGEHLTMPPKKRRKCCCCTWPVCVLITLVILTALGITVFFVLPRVPTVSIKDAIPASRPNISENPPFVDMNFTMVVEIDNNKNYVAYKFNKIDVAVFDRGAASSKPVATGTKLDYTLLPKRVNTIEFPLNVNYQATTRSDPVIIDFLTACAPDVDARDRTKLKLRVEVELSIWGIDWIFKPKISEPIPDIDCPVNV